MYCFLLGYSLWGSQPPRCGGHSSSPVREKLRVLALSQHQLASQTATHHGSRSPVSVGPFRNCCYHRTGSRMLGFLETLSHSSLSFCSQTPDSPERRHHCFRLDRKCPPQAGGFENLGENIWTGGCLWPLKPSLTCTIWPLLPGSATT